jgi:hypothetical protein
LAATINDLLEKGILILKDGKIISNPEMAIVERESLTDCLDQKEPYKLKV